MKHFLLFFLPFLIFSQQDNLSDGTGSYRQYFDENKTSRKHVLKNVIGSRYYHEDYVNTIINGKKILVGFAFKDEEHYQTSWRKFLYHTESPSLDLYGTFREGYTVTGMITNPTIFSSINYQWQKSLSVTQKFQSISGATTESFEIPSDGTYTNHYIQLQASCILKNGKQKVFYSKPSVIEN